MFVCVSVCERERERGRESLSVCVRERVSREEDVLYNDMFALSTGNSRCLCVFVCI